MGPEQRFQVGHGLLVGVEALANLVQRQDFWRWHWAIGLGLAHSFRYALAFGKYIVPPKTQVMVDADD